jgi:hypothetical protein
MNMLLAASVLALSLPASAAVVDHDRREPAPADVLALSPSARQLRDLLSFASADALTRADLQAVLDCARRGGAVGLDVGERDAAVLCERVLAHDRVRESVSVSAAVVDAYDRASGANLWISNGLLASGLGAPAPGGMPSANVVPITPADAVAAVRALSAPRPASAPPPRAALILYSTPAPDWEEAHATPPASDSATPEDGDRPTPSRDIEDLESGGGSATGGGEGHHEGGHRRTPPARGHDGSAPPAGSGRGDSDVSERK